MKRLLMACVVAGLPGVAFGQVAEQSAVSGDWSAFWGNLLGSLIGLLAILIGALYNAHLNRKRDDQIRRQDGHGLAVAIRSELQIVMTALERNIEPPSLEHTEDSFFLPDLAHLLQLKETVYQRITILDSSVIRSVLASYAVIDQFYETVVMLGGVVPERSPAHRRIVLFPAAAHENFSELMGKMKDEIAPTLTVLEDFIGRTGGKRRSAVQTA